MINNRIIAFTGTHGTGKTTSAMDYAARLKCDHPKLTVGLITDIERQCPYRINQRGNEKTQQWIFTHMLAAEADALARHDLVVSDRTMMDVIAYTLALGFKAMADDMVHFLRRHFDRTYRKIFFLSTVTHNFAYADGVRDTEPTFRQRVEDILMTLYARTGVKNSDCYLVI